MKAAAINYNLQLLRVTNRTYKIRKPLHASSLRLLKR